MPAIAGSQPSLRLLIAGKTHPAYVEATGVRYDTKLRQLAQDLDVSDRLILRHTYLSDLALEQYMVAADLYVAPYSYLGQTSSGMIPLAMSAGCVVVSSPFLHAISLLGEGRGVVTPANHPSFLSLALIDVLDDSAAFEAKAERAKAAAKIKATRNKAIAKIKATRAKGIAKIKAKVKAPPPSEPCPGHPNIHRKSKACRDKTSAKDGGGGSRGKRGSRAPARADWQVNEDSVLLPRHSDH